MRYVPAGDASVLAWLQAKMRTAASVLAVCPTIDVDGIGLLVEPLVELHARGGDVRILVPTGRDAEAVRSGLPRLPGSVVEVTAGLPGVGAVVFVSADGSHSAYLGSSGWTGRDLRQGAPGVLMDQRRDDPAAATLRRDLTAAIDEAVGAATGIVSLEDLLQPTMDALESVSGGLEPGTGQRQPTGRCGLATGLAALDRLTGGLWPGHVWVITGRSGSGKSVLSLDLARAAAVQQRESTALVLSREDRREMTVRLLSAEARVPLHHLHLGDMSDDNWARLARRMGELAEAPIVVTATGCEQQPGTAASQLEAAQAVADDRLVRVVVIDDLDAGDTASTLRDVKALAVRQQLTAVVVLRDHGDPDYVDGLAARSSDLALRIDRDHEMVSTTGSGSNARGGGADFLVLRHRRGPTELITVAFQGHYSRFMDFAPD